MTAPRDAIDYTTLGWVKPEVDETLRQARIEIEDFADDPTDSSRMRFCASYLHQVQGTLRMVELYAPAMVVEEMEQLAQALQAGDIGDCDAACATLMRGAVLLPDYLERLQSGYRDIPIVLLPLLNELRAARGQVGLSESVLFAPDLARPLPASLPPVADGAASSKDVEMLPMVERLSAAVAAWPETGEPADATELHDAITALIARTRQDDIRRMLWVAGAVASALGDAAMVPSASLRQAFVSVQREARRQFEDDGFGIPNPETTLEPTRQLLYHVAHSHADRSALGGHPALDALRSTFDLDAQLPTESEISHAQGSLSGRNRALLDTVAAAVKEDLLRVKDALDLHLRATDADVAGLQPQVESLGRVADTLGMLGLGVARGVVQQQRDAMQAIVNGEHSADEGALLDVAGALLYVDATLDDQVARLGDSDAGDSQDDLFSGESRKLMEVIAREAIANFADARQAFVAFVETSWDHAELAEVPRLLREVAGAMTMLELDQPAAYLDGVRMFTEIELIGRRRVPNGRQLDTFADALASFEYYLEALRENRRNRDNILDIARSSLETLNYWPLPEATAPAVNGDADAADAAFDQPRTALDRSVATSIDHGIDLQPTPATGTAARAPSVPAAAMPLAAKGEGVGGFEATGDEIDDEIREVFLEEFGEEIDNLDKLLPLWRAEPDNTERLRPIRRVFHTLKGSGRLVGARVLGEFSWKVENMLNRVLDGTREPSAAVVAMVDNAFYTLPQLLSALRGDGAVSADLDAMQTLADRIAEGGEVFAEAPAPTVMPTAVARAPLLEAPVEFAVAAADAAEPVVDAIATPAVVRVPASLDALLLEILDAEVSGHLATLDHWLSGARAAPPRASEALLRATHTMNGAFAMTEVPAITEALGPAEGYIRRLLASEHGASDDGVAAIAELAGLVRATMVALHAKPPMVPTCEALTARLVALRDALPERSAPIASHMPDAPEVAVDWSESDAAGAHDGFELTELDLSEYGNLANAADARAAADAADATEPVAVSAAAAADHAVALGSAADALPIAAAEAVLLAAERIRFEQAEHARRATAAVAASFDGRGPTAPAHNDDTADVLADVAPDLDDVRDAAVDPAVVGALAAAQSSEAALAERARAEAERIAAEDELEYARLEAEYAEAARIAREQQQQAERLEAERQAAERAEIERLAAEQAEADRSAAQAARLEAERLEAERQTAEQAEIERLAAEQAQADRSAAQAERLEAERLEAEGLETERLAQEAAEREPLDAERAEQAARDEETLRQAAEQSTLASEVANLEQRQRLEQERHAAAEHRDRVDAAVSALLADALATTDDPDAVLDLSGLDPELVDIFVEEAGDLLDHADGLLAQLRAAPGERELLVGLQRDLHTIKGGARMAGIMAIGELGHAMESLLEAVVDQRRELDSDGVPLLERGFDRLHAMLTRVGNRLAIDPSDVLIAAFNARAGGNRAPERGAPDDGDMRLPAAKVALAPLSSPIGDALSNDDDDIGVRAPQEQVRIRADLLDRLVNYAGEVAIYRARLEQQLGAFRSAMAEMAQTNLRLRDQLRRLDIETEAQIIARFQREHDSNDATFDPLEPDRFSTLQQLSRALGESAADMASLQGTLDDLTRQYETLLLQQSRVSSDLQQGLMRTRMVPFDALVPRLRRVVRQAASDTGKPVQLKLDGAQGELDRNVLERMTAPLEHMLRNAVAHGLEDAAGRRMARKSDEGTVRIAVRREGSEVVLEVGDDGGGLDRGAIRRRAEERGLLRTDAILADSDLDAMILQPGFSTAGEVSRLAGRGVGMDVVASEVRQLGGTLDIGSRDGQGTTFTLRLPQTLAVTQAVFVKIGETSFAVPIASVRGAGRLARAGLDTPGASYAYGGEDYLVHDLGGLVGHAPAKAEGQMQLPVLLIRAGDLRAAVVVDQIVGNREIVVKPVGPQVASIPGIFGATVMGDGGVVVILDIAPLVRRQAALPHDVAPVAALEQRRVPLVMVVDDSVTMRKVTGRVLERHNFEVISARDGIDALERMAERVPDLMLLDIEMPRMDGYALATQMKADPRLRDVPIVMITSRTGEKHRQRAFEIGVERYLGKPYQENELIRNVYDLLKLQHRNDG
ncbi:MAG: Hpt domain-containing protein [Luteimonas sp.]